MPSTIPDVWKTIWLAALGEGGPIPESFLLLSQLGTGNAGFQVLLHQIFALNIAISSPVSVPAPASVIQLRTKQQHPL